MGWFEGGFDIGWVVGIPKVLSSEYGFFDLHSRSPKCEDIGAVWDWRLWF